MKTLLLAGLAGVLAVAPASAIAAIDSASDGAPKPSVDLAFASSTALANPAAGAKTMPRMGQMGNMSHARGMKTMGNMHRMKGFRHVGSHVRRGRMGYDKGYRKPHRGFRLPRNFVRPSFFIGNFGFYGLRQPNHGYGWSRYYDDAVLTDRYGVVQEARHNVDWDRYHQGYQDGYHAGQATYDPSVFTGDDRVVATPHAYSGQSSYQGEWQGTYRDADGRVYEGEYSGTFIGDGHMAPHWGSQAEHYPGGPAVDDGRNEEMAYLEHCKKSSGIGGAIVGGAIGALAGNRIAGRGNRLGGSLIGGGLGAVAGAAIDQGSDQCRNLLRKYGYDQQHGAPYPAHPPIQHHGQAYPSGWNGYYTTGYYYPQAQPMITTIVVQSAPVTTTTTTTYVEEEVVHSKPTYKKRWKPASKAVPLKGCQQARCMYD